MSDQPTTLTWGVKQSFRNYVQSMGGTIETAAGAEPTADGEFTFAMAPGSDLSVDANGKPQGKAAFIGEVRFAAHGGMLSVFFADPALEFGPASATLTVADTEARTVRIEIAKLDLTKISTGDDGEIVIPTALSMYGGQLLGDHYPPGTPVDPVRLKPGAA
jgi:hypothetical protein